jgi:hypothetical protein
MRSTLEQTAWVVEDVKRELNKLYKYVTPEVIIDKICWRIKDNVECVTPEELVQGVNQTNPHTT